MKILVHDFSGHPFQAELSRELARRGHDVVHSACDCYVSGKGRLEAAPGETIRFENVGEGLTFTKDAFAKRLLVELRLGFALARHVRRERPDIAMMSNVQIPTLLVFSALMALVRQPWVLWHQDVYSVALRSFVGSKVSRHFRFLADLFEAAERFSARRATAVVAIADAFVDVHRRWGTDQKVTVIPNWAPLDEIVPCERKNDWAVDHHLDDPFTLLYAGTLGLKHDPALLVKLAAEVAGRGRDVRLVVVNEGPAAGLVRDEAARLGVALTLLPFQPYEQLSQVLATGDVLVVLLEKVAGEFSVPSKTLSYLCAGRPIVGLMPPENSAAGLIESTGGRVATPEEAELPAMADWIEELAEDPERRERIGRSARALAEEHFALAGCADRFEAILAAGAR